MPLEPRGRSIRGPVALLVLVLMVALILPGEAPSARSAGSLLPVRPGSSSTSPSSSLHASPTASSPSVGEARTHAGMRPAATWAVTFYVVNRTSSVGVPGASVWMNRTLQGTTDATGHLISLHPWANGTYPLTASATGFQTDNTTATVAGTSLLRVPLNSTYQGPLPPGRLEGSYFPASASFEIDQVTVLGRGTNAEGGVILDMNLSQGTHSWRLTKGSVTAVGTFGIESGYVTWAHFSVGNSSAPSGGGPFLGVSSDTLLVDLSVGVVVGLLVAALVVVLARRRRGRGLGSPPREALSPAPWSGHAEETAEDGHAGGDPATETGAGHPGP